MWNCGLHGGRGSLPYSFIRVKASGETADTLAAVRLVKEKGAMVLGVCNGVGSGNGCKRLYPCRTGNRGGLDQSIYGTNCRSHDVSPFGRGYQYPVALEGALKLKEISYIHAEGYPAAEMKHGPIALIDEKMPVFVIATRHTYYEKIVSNIKEVGSRKGNVIALINPGDETVKNIAQHTLETLTPLLIMIPLQLISYHIGVLRGCNVDMSRNLAKSVTVE